MSKAIKVGPKAEESARTPPRLKRVCVRVHTGSVPLCVAVFHTAVQYHRIQPAPTGDTRCGAERRRRPATERGVVRCAGGWRADAWGCRRGSVISPAAQSGGDRRQSVVQCVAREAGRRTRGGAGGGVCDKSFKYGNKQSLYSL